MTILGGTAIDLELIGTAVGAIIGASLTAKLFVTLGEMISGGSLRRFPSLCRLDHDLPGHVRCLGHPRDEHHHVWWAQEAGVKHRIIWGVLLTLVIGTLLVAGGGGLEAIKSAMIIGALPFTFVMVLMCVSLAEAMYNDARRDKATEAIASPAE